MTDHTPAPDVTSAAPDAALLDFLPDAYLVLDPAGAIRDASRALSSLFGHGRRYAIGKPLAAYIHSSRRELFLARLARATTTDQTQVFETQLRPHRSGPPTEVRAWLGALRDSAGVLIGFRCLLRDITVETTLAARLTAVEAGQEQAMRRRTMELEASVRMLQAQLTLRPPAGSVPDTTAENLTTHPAQALTVGEDGGNTEPIDVAARRGSHPG